MEQLVRVKEVFDNGTADVLLIRESACSGDCHKCSGCGAVQQAMLLTANNPVGAKPGDTVVISSESGPVLMGALVLYMVPLFLFIAGYIAGLALWERGALTGVLAFGIGIALAVIYDRKIVKKKNTVYTITGIRT